MIISYRPTWFSVEHHHGRT